MDYTFKLKRVIRNITEYEYQHFKKNQFIRQYWLLNRYLVMMQRVLCLIPAMTLDR